MDSSQLSPLPNRQTAQRPDNQFQGPTGQAQHAQHSTDVEEKRAIEQVAASERNKPKPNPEQPQELDQSQLEAVTNQMQDFMNSLNRDLQFSVHEESGRDMVSIIDRQSQEVIRQIPSEEMLDIVARISEASGLFVQTEV